MSSFEDSEDGSDCGRDAGLSEFQREGITVTTPYPHIYHLEFGTSFKLAIHFLRYQEFRESRVFKGKFFNLLDYLEWHTSKDGVFSHPHNSNGYCISSDVLVRFLGDAIPDPNRYDRYMSELIRFAIDREGGQPFYFVGTLESDPSAIRHQLAHAFFGLNPQYRQEVVESIGRLPDDVYQIVKNHILEMEEIVEDVNDEANALFVENKPQIIDRHLRGFIDRFELEMLLSSRRRSVKPCPWNRLQPTPPTSSSERDECGSDPTTMGPKVRGSYASKTLKVLYVQQMGDSFPDLPDWGRSTKGTHFLHTLATFLNVFFLGTKVMCLLPITSTELLGGVNNTYCLDHRRLEVRSCNDLLHRIRAELSPIGGSDQPVILGVTLFDVRNECDGNVIFGSADDKRGVATVSFRHYLEEWGPDGSVPFIKRCITKLLHVAMHLTGQGHCDFRRCLMNPIYSREEPHLVLCPVDTIKLIEAIHGPNTQTKLCSIEGWLAERDAKLAAYWNSIGDVDRVEPETGPVM